MRKIYLKLKDRSESTCVRGSEAPHNAISLFSGAGGDTLGLENASYRVVAFSEFIRTFINTHQQMFPHSKLLEHNDNTNIRLIPDEVFIQYRGTTNLVFAGFPCFVKGTKVLTFKGYKNIEDVTLTDQLLTHTGTFQKIINLQQKVYCGELYEFRVKYHSETIRCTEDHPFYVREKKQTTFGQPIWKKANEITDHDYFGMVVDYDQLMSKNTVLVEDKYSWYPLVKMTKTCVTNVDVYNFEVEHDNSYIVENTIVHNCQGFSHAGKKKENDPRNELVYDFIRSVRCIRPEWIIGENVSGLLSRNGINPKTGVKMGVINIIDDLFTDIGYSLTWRVVTATDFGVPQKRKRLIIIGHGVGQSPTIEKQQLLYPHFDWDLAHQTALSYPTSKTSIREILEDTLEGAIEFSRALALEANVPNTWIKTKLTTTPENNTVHPNLIRLMSGIRGKTKGELAENSDTNTNTNTSTIIVPNGLISFGHRSSGYHGEVVDPDQPSKTIICTYGTCPRLFVGMYNPENDKYWIRTFTVTELAQIQSFPKDFHFCGNTKDIITQIGNAVPPTIIRAISSQLKNVVFKQNQQGAQRDQADTSDTSGSDTDDAADA